MGMIIAGKECDNCEYCTINDRDISRVKVHCAARGKEYYYGQCIQCDDKVKVKKIESTE